MARDVRNKQINTVQEACAAYLRAVADVPWITEIVLDSESRKDPTIWTVISAPPFEKDYRTPVYQGMGEVELSLAAPLVRFEMVNLRELPNGVKPEHLLPVKAKVLRKG